MPRIVEEAKKRNFDRGQTPTFKIPLLLQMVGIARFELATFCPPDKRANQAALYPEQNECNILAVPENANSKSELFMFLIPFFVFSFYFFHFTANIP